ncbi:MAG: neutral zinc metallopeptidase [Fimbriimonadaceae bacterium]
MRLDDARESENVEDRRGMSPKTMVAGGGIGTILIALVIMALGGDPQQVLDPDKLNGTQTQQRGAPADPNDPGAVFVKKILGETEDVWNVQFRQLGRSYKEPVLVMFSGQVESACGLADAAVGPFYCPGDNQVYIDLAFYDVLREQLGAKGDFAQAYVIAHEVGHHVQNLLGVSKQVDAARQRLSEKEFNRVSVRMELQADFYAGLWAHYAKNLKLNEEDIREALEAANAIGDDTLQRHSQGRVVPDAFTHGTSEQRMKWFMKGFQTGDIDQGDTFNSRNL